MDAWWGGGVRCAPKVRDTEIYFDIEGAGLVADGPRMREKPPAFIIHGGPGGDHTDLKTRLQCAQRPHAARLLRSSRPRPLGAGSAVNLLPRSRTTSKTWRRCASTSALNKFVPLTVSHTAAWWGCHTRCANPENPLAPDRRPRHIAEPRVFLTRAQENLAERGTPEQQEISPQRMFAG